MDITFVLFYDVKYTTSEEIFSRYINWLKTLPELSKYPAIGERFTYKFTPTSIGLICIVYDEYSKQEFDLTDYGRW